MTSFPRNWIVQVFAPAIDFAHGRGFRNTGLRAGHGGGTGAWCAPLVQDRLDALVGRVGCGVRGRDRRVGLQTLRETLVLRAHPIRSRRRKSKRRSKSPNRLKNRM